MREKVDEFPQWLLNIQGDYEAWLHDLVIGYLLKEQWIHDMDMTLINVGAVWVMVRFVLCIAFLVKIVSPRFDHFVHFRFSIGSNPFVRVNVSQQFTNILFYLCQFSNLCVLVKYINGPVLLIFEHYCIQRTSTS